MADNLLYIEHRQLHQTTGSDISYRITFALMSLKGQGLPELNSLDASEVRNTQTNSGPAD